MEQNKSPNRWGPLGLLFLSLLLPGVVVAQPEYTLVRDWEVSLGPASRGMVYRVAVCPSGTNYLTDGRGRLAVINGGGQVLSDQTHRETEGLHVTACGPSEQLIAAGRSRLTVGFRLRDGSWTFTSRVLDFTPTAIATAQDGAIFLLGARREGSHDYIHRLTPEGEAIAAFAPLSAFGPPEDAEAITRDLSGASLLLDDKQQRILVFSTTTYELHVFDFTGRRAPKRARSDPGWRQPQSVAVGERHEPADQVTRVVRLPDGRFAARINHTERRAENIYRSSGYLEVLDQEFRTAAPRIRASAYGLLHGADARGGLYFTNANPDGLRVARVTLAERDRAPE